MSDDEKKARAERLRELRLALGFRTQEALADASPDNTLERTYVVRAENAGNAVSTRALQRSFAGALRVSVDDFADYLDGRLTLEDVVARRNAAVHGGVPDIRAVEFIASLERIPGLKAWAEKKDSDVTLAELVQGVQIIEKGTASYARPKDLQPHGGWERFFRDLRAGKLQPREPKSDLEVLRNAELRERPVGQGDKIRIPTKKPRTKGRGA